MQYIQELIKLDEKAPRQGTKEWLEVKQYTIGGSDIAKLIGCSGFGSERAIIEKNIGLSYFEGNYCTFWGNIMEDLVIELLEKKWNTKIYEFGSLPGVVPGQRYSPDGVVYLEHNGVVFLIEIKCPIRRIVDDKKKVPSQYRPQIFTGIDVLNYYIPSLIKCVFIDCMIRCCSKSNFIVNNSYNREVHGDKDIKQNPTHMGVMIITSPDDVKLSLDIGSLNIPNFEKQLKTIHTQKLDTEFLYIESKDFKDIDTNLKSIKNIRGLMYFKIFKINEIEIFKDDWKKLYKKKNFDTSKSFILNIAPHIERVTNIMQSIKNMSKSEKITKLNQLYPNDLVIDYDEIYKRLKKYYSNKKKS